jgi:peptidoglycan/LPS O-acetylase OafA/YrhL
MEGMIYFNLSRIAVGVRMRETFQDQGGHIVPFLIEKARIAPLVRGASAGVWDLLAKLQPKSRDNIDMSQLKSGEIPGVDGLRAVSILIVMISHFGFPNRIPGGLGVTIFFFISGFLITTLMLREAGEKGNISIRNFYMRRFLRLQPELFAYVLLSALIGIAYFGMPRFSDFTAAFLYVTNYYAITVSGLKESFTIRWSQIWSLAVEEHYYLTYPLLFAATIRTPRHLLAIMIAICGALLAWRGVLVWNGVFQPHTYMATDTRLDSIAYGCLAAVLLWRFNAALAYFARWFTLPLGVSIILISTAVTSPVFRETARYSLQGIALLFIFLGLFTPMGRIVIFFLELPPMRWMGRMSYAAYLWGREYQLAVGHFFDPNLTTMGFGMKALITLVGLAVTFAIAALSHHYIYRRTLAIRRKFGSHAAI